MATREQTTLADRCKLAASHHILCLCTSVDVRDTDPLSTSIESPVDQILIVPVHPDYRSHAPDVTGTCEVPDLLCVDRSVFAFKPDPVESVRSECVDLIPRIEPGGDQRGLPVSQLSFDFVLSNLHVNSCSVVRCYRE